HPHPHSFPTRRSSDLASLFMVSQPGSCRRSSEDDSPEAPSRTLRRSQALHPYVSRDSCITQWLRRTDAQGPPAPPWGGLCSRERSEEHTSELQSRSDL